MSTHNGTPCSSLSFLWSTHARQISFFFLISGPSNTFRAQQREAGPLHPNVGSRTRMVFIKSFPRVHFQRNFVDDLAKLSTLGDALEQGERQPKASVVRATSAAR